MSSILINLNKKATKRKIIRENQQKKEARGEKDVN